ncbi:hypothetical protein D3C73_492010 [compost metagenome]
MITFRRNLDNMSLASLMLRYIVIRIIGQLIVQVGISGSLHARNIQYDGLDTLGWNLNSKSAASNLNL